MKHTILLALLCSNFITIQCAEKQKKSPIMPTCKSIAYANIAHELVSRYPDITREELVNLLLISSKKNPANSSPMLQQIWHHIEIEKTKAWIHTVFPATIDPEVYKYNFVINFWTSQAAQTRAVACAPCLSSNMYNMLQQLYQGIQKMLGHDPAIYRQYIYMGKLTATTDSTINTAHLEKDRMSTNNPVRMLLLFHGTDFAHVILADQDNVFVFPHIMFVAQQTDERILMETLQQAVEQGKEKSFANIPAALGYIRLLMKGDKN